MNCPPAITDEILFNASREIRSGLINQDLGHGLIRKKILISPDTRDDFVCSIVLAKDLLPRVFIHGFPLNDAINVNRPEFKPVFAVLINLSADLQKLNQEQLASLAHNGELEKIQSGIN